MGSGIVIRRINVDNKRNQAPAASRPLQKVSTSRCGRGAGPSYRRVSAGSAMALILAQARGGNDVRLKAAALLDGPANRPCSPAAPLIRPACVADYRSAALRRADLAADPVTQFRPSGSHQAVASRAETSPNAQVCSAAAMACRPQRSATRCCSRP